jgi:hypothetical protein
MAAAELVDLQRPLAARKATAEIPGETGLVEAFVRTDLDDVRRRCDRGCAMCGLFRCGIG